MGSLGSGLAGEWKKCLKPKGGKAIVSYMSLPTI